MISICKKIISGLCFILIVSSLVQITSAQALEMKNKINISQSKSKTETSKKTTYNKVIDRDKETLNISLLPLLVSTTLQVPLELNNDESAVLYQNESGRTLNSGNIFNKQHHSIGIIDIEIVNNDEKAQLTSTILENNILQLNVKTKNVSNLINIQVKTSATSFSTYFTKSEWIHRGGITSLSLSQKQDITNLKNSDLNSAIKIDAWDKIKSIHETDIKWSNSGGMQDQFDCHFDFTKNKNAWNLEPSRPDVDYFSTVVASCNPK